MTVARRYQHLYTVPNLVTLLRPVGTVPFVYLCLQSQRAHRLWHCVSIAVLFILIVSSDVLDGRLARRLQQENAFGRLFDHVCDVGFILTALGVFVFLGWAPWWLPAAIVWSFALYAINSWWRTATPAAFTLLASRLGHLGGILNYATVGLLTGHLCTGGHLPPARMVQGWCAGVAILALLSGGEHLMFLAGACCSRYRAKPRAGTPPRSNR